MILTAEKAKELLKQELKETMARLESVKSPNDEIAIEQQKVQAWIFRKSYPHPYMVYQCNQDLKKEPEIISKIKDIGFSPDDAFRIVDVNAYMHDIGRLREVDFSTGVFLDSQKKKEQNFSHAKASYDILKEMGVTDKNILLPIKYHDVRDFHKVIQEDEEFKQLNPQDQASVMFFGNMILDTDKMSNILEVSSKGLTGRLELMDAKYKQEAKISPKVKEAILNGQNPNRDDENTRADALARFATWTANLNFNASKSVAKGYMDGIFRHIKNEMTPENKNSEFVDDVNEIYIYLKSSGKDNPTKALKIGKDRDNR